jgi:hypothetical protein
MPLAIDTLNIYSRLKATGLSEDSAREIAEVFREMIEENLASKNDLKTTESNLTKYIESVRAELKKDIELLRAELRTEIAESKVSVVKWVAGMLIAQAAFIVTLIKLL